MSNSNDGRLISPIKSLRAVQERLTEAVLARHVFNHPQLVSEVRRLLSGSDPNGGALAQQPILEAIFPYLLGEQTLDQLSGKLVDAKVIDALSTPAPERQYAFPRSLKPYSHQIESWTLLRTAVPQSVLVTSGTGSGKTECFLIPVLDDLAREVSSAGRLSGVRAIALYPLNALISSQEERLREWTAPFKGGIRFGLYNGLMPEDRRASGQRAEQVEDRKTLRADPPPILVTNVTMLEYMTVRRQDRPLIEASSGKLRWIILDEAHSYVGSRAAEIALLIRRVLLAFKVKPTEVRFVATSATIGEGVDVEAKLKAFLRDVAGVPEDRVHVVIGHRRKPILPAPAPAQKLALTDVRDQGKLAGNPVVQKLMRLFDQGPVRWSEFSEHAQTVGIEGESLIQAFAARPAEGEPLLPIRAHGFVRGVQGIYACLNPMCVRSPEGWPFGAILPEAVQSCPHCGSVVLEIERCDECGEPFLGVVERQGRLGLDLVLSDDDEFAADSENERVAPDEEDDAEPAGVVPDIGRRIAVRDLKGGNILHVDPSTGDVRDRADDATIALLSFGLDACPACDCRSAIFVKFRSGAPFLVGNAAPVLLEGIAARVVSADPDEPVADEGRQLLSFTDSRQGTARFAALLQNGSERNYVRAAIYHAVQDTLRPPPGAKNEIAAKNAQIAELERLVSTTPVLGEFLDRTKKERDALVNPGIGGLGWTRLREQLSVRPEIDVLMRKVWRFRDERFLKSNLAFTEFLMLRELARRPRRAVALETMGLAGLRYPAIDLVWEQRLPRLFREKGLTIESYREFLRGAMSLSVRDRFAIRMDRENVHWFSGQVFQRWLTPPAAAAFPAGDGSGQRGMWPSPSGRSGIVRFLEALFGLDRNDKQDRTELRAILEQAWDDLLPLLSQPGAGNYYALDFEKVNVAPVKEAFLCPVTRRLTDVVVAGLSPFGFGKESRFARQQVEVFAMPVHPNPFLLPERGGTDVVHEWLRTDVDIDRLRGRGLWTNIHDRVALGSPYFRAAEHSAQQPASRLRGYEKDFKEGRINVLNCSTTMEMGVDIGSVSTVMMTNVPPSAANYRQRIGRAGRRGQGFALALTYARPSPLDRETFRDPVGYLNRRIEAPKVSLDSKRIVQRHVNALLLAEWFRLANGEPLRTKIGDFFGCSPAIGGKREPEAASVRFRKWAQTASVVSDMMPLIAILVAGSALTDGPELLAAAAAAVKAAEAGFVAEWEAMQAQAASMDREVAKKSLGFQLKRMCGENVLGELADRGVLPGHGFPTDVVSFVNKDQPDKDEDADEDRFRRRSYPSRNLDIAIRDYAPGADIVLDGLVYKSAGVTLNWKRPAGESEVREIQSLKWFWQCRECGAAGTNVIKPDECLSCRSELSPDEAMRFLRPAGFTVDMTVKPHAEIEEVAYIPPEPERVSTRGAKWQAFPGFGLGRIRSSSDGFVFYSSKGGATGYSVCLECGRAEAGQDDLGTSGARPLKDHRPLRFTKSDTEGKCPGNAHSFSILTGLALGHEISTDVVEVQPANLGNERAAWALASAMREALARRLGVESAELGVAVTPHETSVGGVTHSMFLYDRAAGGAGFAPRLVDLFAEVLRDAGTILDCRQPGCVRCCSSCVLASDLATRSDSMNRKTALQFLNSDFGKMSEPSPEDVAAPGALLSIDVCDEVVAAATRGVSVVLWPDRDFDPAALGAVRMRYTLSRLQANGASVAVCLEKLAIAGLDAAQKLALRDSAIRHGLQVAVGGRPTFANGAVAIVALSSGRTWASRDGSAGQVGEEWGLGRSAPMVWFDGAPRNAECLDIETLLPTTGTRFVDIGNRLDGDVSSFGNRFLGLIQPQLAQAGLWRPGELTGIEYSDRYVNSPLTAVLVVKAIAGLAGQLSAGRRVDARVATAPLRALGDRSPYRINHDWLDEPDRAQVMSLLARRAGLEIKLDVDRRPHSRRLRLAFGDKEAIVVFDQGFGFLRTVTPLSFDFRAAAEDQERRLSGMRAALTAGDSSFFVVTPERN